MPSRKLARSIAAGVATIAIGGGTSAGQKVTINEASSTAYQKGTSPASTSAVTAGEPVLVLGTTSGTTITATQVTVQPAGGYTASSTQVIPFKRGTPTTSKQIVFVNQDFKIIGAD